MTESALTRADRCRKAKRLDGGSLRGVASAHPDLTRPRGAARTSKLAYNQLKVAHDQL